MNQLPNPDYAPEFYTSVPAKRLFAWIVDGLVICALCAAVVVFTAFIGLFFIGFLFLIIGFCYRIVTLANGSATWGMRFAGIELRDFSGARLTLPQAVLHTLAYSVSFAFFPIQCISIVLMLTNAQGQGIADMFTGTVMLNRRA
ncbi:RDD family protein [Epibacterium sp. SM1969]|uniref:RDD family protein n=1 Tax=Tritonibacter aquimaris TaxID=2663379 RepID=A0A844AYB9_9RHOB|nr:RDD family protein [Tritonibacter aquimaris]MQY42952.1 RDD family protein [Tritonibacter aquimaris]